MSEERPTVSVIIPAYNSAKYLPQAIDSVLQQTYNDYEIIIINDGSTDNTPEVIQPYLKLSAVRYFAQENLGVSAARNRGLQEARGEFIAFLDADDIYFPDKLQAQIALFAAHPQIGIVNSGFRIIQENGEPIMDVKRWKDIPDLTPEIWLLHKPVLPSAMMYRKEWFDRVGEFDPELFSSEDVEVTLRMVAQGCQAMWLPEITIYYRRHQASVTWKHTLRQAENSEEMQNKFLARSDIPESMRKVERQSRHQHLVWLGWLCYQNGFYPEMGQYLWKSFQYTSYSWVETIAGWVNTLENSSRGYGCQFDPHHLNQLAEWQQVISKVKISPVLNRYRQTLQTCQQTIEYEPENEETIDYALVYAQLASELRQQRRIDEAINLYRQAIELEPHNPHYHHGLGCAYQDRYDLDDAIAALQRANKLKPDDASIKEYLTTTLELHHRWQQVREYCQHQSTKTDKPRILMIFPYPPYPPQSGGAIRMFEQIKYFGKRYHLTVVTNIYQEADRAIESHLAAYCDRAFTVKTGVPMSAYKPERQQQLYFLKTWSMWKTLQQLSQIDFQIVFFDFIVSTGYYPLFADRPTILHEHNIESSLLKGCAKTEHDSIVATLAREINSIKPFLNASRQSRQLADYEQRTWHKFPLRTVVSQADKLELDSRCQTGKTIVVKNGIDTQAIVSVDNSNASKILFMGTMGYYPNIDAVLYFIEAILPTIRQHNNNYFCIAGREPPVNIRELTKSDLFIEVIANPQNMSEVARQCQMTVVPLRLGSGTRIKILHSLAMGLPVVSTSLGSEGLEVIDGEHLLIRDDPAAVLEISSNPNLREKLKTNGRKLVEAKYDWENIFAEYEREIQSIIGIS
jgi:glycosyltransferase involved in cell wall biosynthesis